MKTIEKDRSQLSYQLSPQDQQRQAIQQQQAELDAQPVRRGPGRPRRVGRPKGT